MDIQKEMAQYENILSSLGYGHRSLSKSDLGYLNPITQFGFEIWYESQKAAKAQAVPEVLKKFCNEHKDPAWRGRLTEYDKGYSDCCIAVLEMIEAQQPSSTSDCPDEP